MQRKNRWTTTPDKKKLPVCLLLLVLGSSLYGASVGLWRAPLQSAYVAIKFPLLILLTTVTNAAINGMLAQLLGAKITFRQSFMAVILSFTLFAVILGSITPLSFFLFYNLPAMGSEFARDAHAGSLVFHVMLIAFAGIVANLCLLSMLVHICRSRIKSIQILIAWLAGNMFVGCQLSWNLRPFFGTPHLAVSFLREHPFDGTFYEALFRSFSHLIAG